MKQNRGIQLTRILELIRFLSSRRYSTYQDVAAEFSISSKTVQRDLEILENVGFPVRRNLRDEDLGRGVNLRIDRESARRFLIGRGI